MVKWEKKKKERKKMKEVFCADHKEVCLQCSRAATGVTAKSQRKYSEYSSVFKWPWVEIFQRCQVFKMAILYALGI